jgi:hypothetical protein
VFEIGASLREARARMGLDVDAMEQRTKVRAKYLRYLEEERFDQLPGDTYTKGFLRVYANALGLDGQLYVDEYNSRFTHGEDELRPRARRVEPQRHRRQQRRESRLVLVVLALIVIVTGLVIAAWRFGGTETPSVDGLDARTPIGVTTTKAAQRVTIEVKAVKGPSYMEVWLIAPKKPAGRTQLYAGTLEKGQLQRFRNTRMTLFVRKPERVVVRINGIRYVPFDGELNVSGATAVRG